MRLRAIFPPPPTQWRCTWRVIGIPQSSEFWKQILTDAGLDDVSKGLAGRASMVNTEAVDRDATLDLIAAKRWQVRFVF